MENEAHQDFLAQYESIHAPLTRYCRSKAFGIMATEDLVQEAVLTALKRYEFIRDKEKLLSYLIGTVNNIVKNSMRKLSRQGNWEEHFAQQLQSDAPSPEIAAEVNILLKEMSRLPEKQQEALILFEISGFSIKEIAKIQNGTESAIKTRLSRVRKKLRTKLSDQPAHYSLTKTLAAYASILF